MKTKKTASKIVITSVFKITCILTKEGLRWIETEWTCAEKANIFKLTRKDEDGEIITRHLSKSELFKIVNITYSNTSHIEFNMIVTKDKILDAKMLLTEKVGKMARKFKSEIELLIAHLN